MCFSIVVFSTYGIKIWVSVIIITIALMTIYIVAFLDVHPSSFHVKWAAAVAVLKFICGLWYHTSAFSSKNCNFIDKGELTNCKFVNTHCFSPLLRHHSGLINTPRWQWQWGNSQPVGCNITDHVFAPKIANKKWWVKELKNWNLLTVSPHSFCLPALFS